MSDQPQSPSKSATVRPHDKIIPIAPGYVSLSAENNKSRDTAAPRLPVVAIAERSEGLYQACVLDTEGRLQFSSGPVYVDGPTHDETSSSKALQAISQSFKTLVALEETKAKK